MRITVAETWSMRIHHQHGRHRSQRACPAAPGPLHDYSFESWSRPGSHPEANGLSIPPFIHTIPVDKRHTPEQEIRDLGRGEMSQHTIQQPTTGVSPCAFVPLNKCWAADHLQMGSHCSIARVHDRRHWCRCDRSSNSLCMLQQLLEFVLTIGHAHRQLARLLRCCDTSSQTGPQSGSAHRNQPPPGTAISSPGRAGQMLPPPARYPTPTRSVARTRSWCGLGRLAECGH